MPTTAVYAALLALLFVVLSVRVINARSAAKVMLGDAGNVALQRRMRAHANFAEYVPMAVVSMVLAEGLLASALLMHGMGVALLVGRLLHSIGISQTDEPFWMRVAGTAMTFAVMIVGALACLWLGLHKLGKL